MSGELQSVSAPSITILPLGGCGQVGMNATLFVDGQDALLVDCGVFLGVEDAPGVDRVIPDFSAITRDGRRLAGVILTHGHEDHIGALPDLFLELDAKIYGLPLPIALAKARFDNRGMPHDHLQVVEYGQRFSVGPFVAELVRVTHSIPDAAALHLETRAGRILHSGDFKLDETPLDGQKTDVERLQAIGGLGVDLLLSDSTNAERHGRTRSESVVASELEKVALETEGRLVVACFASHFHRLEGLARAAKKSGRKLLLAGASLDRALRIGHKLGRFGIDATPVQDESKLKNEPKSRFILAVTGTQGEPRAALARVASGESLALEPGDRLVLSSTTIPGNEKAVRRIINAVTRRGADVIYDGMRPVHCSGHAHQDEQEELIRLVRPRHLLPIHGDRAMLEAHARLAKKHGVAASVLENGETLVLERGQIRRGPSESAGRTAIDSGSEKPIAWEDVEARKRIGLYGQVSCALVFDERHGLFAPPAISIVGLPGGDRLRLALAHAAEEAALGSELNLEERVQAALRHAIRRRLGSRPILQLQVLRARPRSLPNH
ncbi:MAG: ribonuclease J [Myxococcota bacterium]